MHPRLLLRPAAHLVAVALLWVSLGGCRPSPVDQLVQDSLEHLQAAERLMTEAAGDETKLREAVMLYRVQNAQEFARLRTEGEKQMAALSEEERRAVATAAKARADQILARMQLQAQKFPDSRRALVMVRPLVVAGTPKMAASARPNWVPPTPVAPPMLDMPGAATGHDRGHDDHAHPEH